LNLNFLSHLTRSRPSHSCRPDPHDGSQGLSWRLGRWWMIVALLLFTVNVLRNAPPSSVTDAALRLARAAPLSR